MSERYKDFPKVSVVISTYDRPVFLDRALASVYAQTFDDFEVVIVDDASPDQAAIQKVLEKWAAEFDKRKIDFWAYHLETNSGYQCFPKNRGIERSHGDYIAYLDDDNTWRSNHLQVCVDAIEADFSHDMVYTRLCYTIADEETRKKIADTRYGGALQEGDGLGIEWSPNILTERNFIDTNTIFHSKGAFWRLVRDSGYGWDEKLRRFGDWNFVWRWAMHGNNAKLVDKVTVDYYWHMDMMQLTRPAVEVPVCFNYAQYLATKKETDPLLQSVS